MCKKYIVIILIAVYLLSINAYLVFYAEHQLNLDYIVKYICEEKDESENLCMGNCYFKKILPNLILSITKQKTAHYKYPMLIFHLILIMLTKFLLSKLKTIQVIIL